MGTHAGVYFVLCKDSLDSLQGDLVPEQPEVEYRRVREVVEGGYDV
jgi:hypothetical protein